MSDEITMGIGTTRTFRSEDFVGDFAYLGCRTVRTSTFGVDPLGVAQLATALALRDRATFLFYLVQGSLCVGA